MVSTYGYEAMSLEELGSYIASRPQLAGLIDTDNLTVTEEIGDGNLNFVYRAGDNQGRSLIVKQALPFVRMTGEGWPMTPERARFEASSLKIHGNLVPDLVVRVLDENMDRYIFVMEDLADHTVLRKSLNADESIAGVAAKIGAYVGALAVDTSPLGVNREVFGTYQADFVNSELSTITDDLVFTEPIRDIGRNSTLDANKADAEDFAADPVMKRLNAKAKWDFLTRKEALIHGDLHTGSVMVRADADAEPSVKVFDSEFACLGPVGFDLGAIMANYVIAAARAVALEQPDRARWLVEQCQEVLDGFDAEVTRRIAAHDPDPLWDTEFIARHLHQWHIDAWMFSACKMSRRVVGAAKTADLTTLDPALREGADRGVLLCARQIAQWTVGEETGDDLSTRPARLLEILSGQR
ncbi:MAG: S-methyl-5-thioribose kinase [Corynebacterium sp.]|uniref:S-methyl-5-thioribose kinase n=1 Tax=Corynebacterium sp. TaxID=1720 RepID=UPI0026DC8A87|nr:S-methyl-5-thioribose kinase [Corynebacterium sp.]MDO5099662.1 S-methyl-5-thioribose kinase [Corynebacterium sp.]